LWSTEVRIGSPERLSALPHVTLNAIFAGMMPFIAIQVIALVLLYIFPAIGLWLPSVVFKLE
jgi:TRAP-type mannitol/chloroaromatic compound transport system permease large subunit